MTAPNETPAMLANPATETAMLETPAPEAAVPTLILPLLEWWVGLAVLILLALRFPGSTWPEQLGLLTALVLLFLGEAPGAAILVPVVIRMGSWIARRYSTSLQAT